MSGYVLDASYLIALANAKDALHSRALAFEPTLSSAPRVIHSIALAEAVTVLTMKVKDDARTARDLFDALHDDAEVIHSTDDLMARGMALVEKDTRLSLSDAASIVLASDRKATIVSFDGAFDRHVRRVP